MSTPSRKMRDGFRTYVAGLIHRMWQARPFTSPPTLVRPLVACAGAIYGAGLRHDQTRQLQQRRRLPALVISIGNLVVGGTGKTPLTMWIARYLDQSEGRHVAILSRGYGRTNQEMGQVPTFGDSRSQVARFGDEPILMARTVPRVPIWVGRKRFLSGQAAMESSFVDTLLLDDGFQHLTLYRDADLVLIDTENPFGNGLLLPLGPLREPIENLARADAFVLTRADNPRKTVQLRSVLEKTFPGRPLFTCIHRLTHFKLGFTGSRVPVENLRNLLIVAFAGIARPDSFFDSLEGLDLKLSRTHSFPDHHIYQPNDIVQLMDSVRASRAQLLITTEKDMARLPSEIQPFVLAAGMDLDFGADHRLFRSYLSGLTLQKCHAPS